MLFIKNSVKMSKFKNDLAIIIVNYNTRQLLDDCLESIYRADAPGGEDFRLL